MLTRPISPIPDTATTVESCEIFLNFILLDKSSIRTAVTIQKSNSIIQMKMNNPSYRIEKDQIWNNPEEYKIIAS